MVQQAVRHAADCYHQLRSAYSPKDKRPPELGIINGSSSYMPERGLFALNDALVFSGEWFVAMTGRIFRDLFVHTPRNSMSAYFVGDFFADKTNLICEQPHGPVIDRAFVLGGCRNYCHWLLDFVPRLFYDTDKSLPVLVNGDLAKFQKETLNLLGIDAKRLIRLRYPRTYHVKNLLFPSTRSSCFTPPLTLQPWVVEWLRAEFTPYMNSARPHRRIFISRAHEDQIHQRRLINHDEIAGIAKAHDFEIVRPETLSLSQQIDLFSQAAIIAGSHGAGFANMIFAPNSARIIEFTGPELDKNPMFTGFARLGAVLRQPVTRLVGEGGRPIEAGFPPFETYTIDPKAFAKALEASPSAA